MNLEKISSAIYDNIIEYDFFRFLIKISDYIAYFVSFIILINELTYLGDFINSVWVYLFICSVILNFAAKRYISLEILFISFGFASFCSFVKYLLFLNIHTFSWKDFLAFIVCVFFTFLSSKLYKEKPVK